MKSDWSAESWKFPPPTVPLMPAAYRSRSISSVQTSVMLFRLCRESDICAVDGRARDGHTERVEQLRDQ